MGIVLLDASSRADRVAGRVIAGVGAVGNMVQSVDRRGAFGTRFEEMISTDNAKRVFQIEFNHKPILA